MKPLNPGPSTSPTLSHCVTSEFNFSESQFPRKWHKKPFSIAAKVRDNDKMLPTHNRCSVNGKSYDYVIIPMGHGDVLKEGDSVFCGKGNTELQLRLGEKEVRDYLVLAKQYVTISSNYAIT